MNKLKSILTAFFVILFSCVVNGQNSFVDYQKSFAKVADVFRRKEDTLRKQFEAKGLKWPAKYIYIRSFKYDSQLEVWVKNNTREPFKLFKTFKICAMAGSLGPKRMSGDYQVPEGFYYITEFKPNSAYHLSLGLNYPNASDKMLSDSLYPGGDIFIHGSCVTEGCIPITNDQIEDLYVITSYARAMGQDYIPVHIFPIQFNNPKSVNYLERFLKIYRNYKPLADNLEAAYNYFEKNRQVPVVMINTRGAYLVENIQPAEEKTVKPKRTLPEKKVPIPEHELAKVVNNQPVYPGGSKAFQHFLDETGRELATFLAEGQRAAYLVVDYIIDKEGKPVYARVIKGGNDDINELIEKKFENMPQWKPAIRQEQPVAFRLKQTIVIEAAPGS
ncbi:L,D-transpeptidase family protein [Agriterribacter sp.]|uniref:L,D-transpeptidase family protein n=1 Tax=Agriterribacter sp. TaxID=2821509 RepID=UPI002BF4EB86|nr:L,D-transpeptidase family protein [Agriterribacter sp.]HTN08939.1 L,D-transpeptidase family protein [Agriterribacter sp.]